MTGAGCWTYRSREAGRCFAVSWAESKFHGRMASRFTGAAQ